jgi:hypothetical protein
MLSEEQIDKIRLVLSTDGWNHVIKPAVMNRAKLALKALALTRGERTEDFKGTDFNAEDDILRAMIRDCEWMAVAWDNEISVFEHNRRVDELSAASPAANP